jgi:hypothetical protein
VPGSFHERAACCYHAADFGWWGPEAHGTHCQGCGDNWTGTTVAHTVCCHLTFGGNRGADLYHDPFRSKHGRCPTDDDLAEMGMRVTDDHRGRIWRQPPPPQSAAGKPESDTERSESGPNRAASHRRAL